MEELEKNETSTQAEENTVSLASAQALADALAKIEAYTPTTWVDNSSPDIDAEHLNKPELAIKRVTDALNSAVDVIKDLQSQVTKNAGDISTVNNNLSSGYLQLKVLKTAVRVFTIEVSFTNGIGYIPFSQLFSNGFKPTYATAISVPVELDNEIAVCWGEQDSDNLKLTLSKSYTGRKWITSVVMASV